MSEEQKEKEILKEIKEYADQVGLMEASYQLESDAFSLAKWLEKVVKYSPKLVPSKIKFVAAYFKNVVIPKVLDEATRKFNEMLQLDTGGRNLCVLFPCYKTTNPATAWTLLAMALDFGREKIQFDMELGDADISNARNRLASRFLTKNAEWSLWIDDDIIVPTGRPQWLRRMCGLNHEKFTDRIAGQYIVHKLLSHKQKIVSGVYFGRHPFGPPIFGTGLSNMNHNEIARSMQDSLIETPWVGMGAVMIHRDVFLAIQEKFPELSPANNPNHIDRVTRETWWDFFRKLPGKGEDVSFFERARECGFKVYVDTGLQCMHVGYCAWNATNTVNRPV